MKASTAGENLRSCQAVSTSEAEMPKRSAIGTMTSRFEISACSVKNARETWWQKYRLRRRPFGRERARMANGPTSSLGYRIPNEFAEVLEILSYDWLK